MSIVNRISLGFGVLNYAGGSHESERPPPIHLPKPSDTVPSSTTKGTRINTGSEDVDRKAEVPAIIDVDAVQHLSEPVATPPVKPNSSEPAKSKGQATDPEPEVASTAPKNASKSSFATHAVERQASKKRSSQDLAQNDGPAPKRARVEVAPTFSPAPTRAVTVKKYGKQGRKSSPIPISNDIVNFDSSPKPSNKTRARAMTGTGGKEATKTKPLPVMKETQSKAIKAAKPPPTANAEKRTYPVPSTTVVDLSNVEALNVSITMSCVYIHDAPCTPD